MANDTPSQHGWTGFVAAVKTELGLLTVVVLVVGASFSVASRMPGVSSALLIVAFLSVVSVVIIIAGVLLFYRARTARIDKLAPNKTLAQHLGEEIFQAYDGAIANLLPREQQEAYDTLVAYLTSSKLFGKDERGFVKVLVEAVIHRARQHSRIR